MNRRRCGHPASEGPSPAARALAPVGLFLLAFGVRMLTWPTVAMADRVHFFGMDAYYHMRRVLYTLARFPEALAFDPYIHFPTGATSIWPPFFDWLVAACVLPFHAIGGERLVETLAACVPALLGAGTVLAVYALGRRHFGFRVGLVSGLVLSVLSAHVWYSQMGFVDHHAAVALVATAMLAVAMGLVTSLQDPAVPRARVAAKAAACGALLGVALLVWPGSLLHVALVEAGLALFLLTRARPEAVRTARWLAALHAIAFLVVLPSGVSSSWAQWSDMTPVVLTHFQPWLLGTLALSFAACAGLWASPWAAASAPGRALQAVAVGAAALGVSVLLLPELREAVYDSWRWLARAEVFQEQVGESAPLLSNGGGVDFGIAELRLSRFVYVFPLALGLLAWSERARPEVRLLVVWVAGLALFTLLQRRFFNTFSVGLALVMGWSLVQAHGWLAARLPRAGLAPPLGVAAALLALFLLAPSLATHATPARNALRALRGEPLLAYATPLRNPVLVETAAWLRAHTPPTSGFLDVRERPEYGVLSTWTEGHVLEYVGRRPTVVDNFGDDLGEENFRLAYEYLRARSEAEGAAVLDRLGVRYVVAPAVRSTGPTRGGGLSLAARLYLQDGAGLGRHRLIYESTGWPDPESPAVYKIFEYVRGARVHGRAPAGARVRASLPYRTPRGRTGVFRASAVADARGRFVLRLPYATEGAPPALRTAPAYRVEADGIRTRVRIHEDAVREGREIDLGDRLAAPPEGASRGSGRPSDGAAWAARDSNPEPAG